MNRGKQKVTFVFMKYLEYKSDYVIIKGVLQALLPIGQDKTLEQIPPGISNMRNISFE